jgi:iron(III) transport system substrate-binding protein
MIKKMMAALLALSLSVSLAACSSGTETTTGAGTQASSAPQLSGTMKVVATNETYMTLFNKFAAETGVKVEMLSMSSGEVLSKLRAEGGAPSADLWFGGGNDAFMAAKADGLLEQVNFEAANDLDPKYKDAENYWFSKGVTIVGFVVNGKILEELKLDAPKSWQDLLDPKYKGEIIMSNPAVSGTNYAVVNALLQTMGDEAGWKYFEDLNKNVAYYGRRGSDPLNKVLADEFAIGISYIDGTVDKMIKDTDITIVYPTDGIPWGPDGLGVFKNADNVPAAKYFVEWLFSNDENLKLLAEIDEKTSVKLIKPNMAGVELDYDPSILMEEDLALFGTQRAAILEKFEALMGAKAVAE